MLLTTTNQNAAVFALLGLVHGDTISSMVTKRLVR